MGQALVGVTAEQSRPPTPSKSFFSKGCHTAITVLAVVIIIAKYCNYKNGTFSKHLHYKCTKLSPDTSAHFILTIPLCGRFSSFPHFIGRKKRTRESM